MPQSPQSGLVGVNLKLARAQEHFEAIAAIDERFAAVLCEVVFREDKDKGIGYFAISLPETPLELSTIVGDCLHNLRSTLDYLVWQIVRSNPPNTPERRNMFPICSSPQEFASQVKRGRLRGVPAAATEIIERLQPYDGPDHPLALLNELYNADKHRDLNFTVSVASDLDISFSRNGEVYFRMILGNDEVRNGAILGNVGLRLCKAKSLPEVHVHGQAAAFVAFRDHVSEWDDALGVAATLGKIRDFIVNKVIAALEPFVQ